MQRHRQINAAVVALVAFTACGDDTTSPESRLARIELRHSTRAVSVLDQITIDVVAYDQESARMATPALTWFSDDPAIATVDAGGRVTGQGIGEVMIHATSGVVAAAIRIIVEAASIYVETYLGSPDLVIGQSVLLRAEIRDASRKRIENHPVLTWATGDDAIVSLNSVPGLDASYVQVTGRSTGLASISVGFQGTETMFIVGVIPAPVPADAPVRVSDFHFFRFMDATYVPTMQVSVAAGRAVTMTRMEVAVPAVLPKLLPPLCSSGRLSAGQHGLLGATSYPVQAFNPYVFVPLVDTDGVALLTYRTDDGRIIHMTVRGALDYWGYGSGHETQFPWHVCTSP
jgi:hypothetical protein